MYGFACPIIINRIKQKGGGNVLLALFFMICFASCVLGAICGIGGGMIIKPALDTIGVLDVAAISFYPAVRYLL